MSAELRQPAARGRKKPARRTTKGSLVYGYCVVQGGEPALKNAPSGIVGMSLPRAVSLDDDLWLIVADAPARRFSPPAIERRSADLDWLSACALAHEEVIEHAMRAPAVAPLKLFTLFSSEAAARRRLRSRIAGLRTTMRRLTGCAEWGVRVHAGKRQAPPPPSERPASGRGFLERKRDARRVAAQDLAEIRDLTRRAYGLLGKVARAKRQLERPPGTSPGLLLDAAFLVPAARRPDFESTLDGIAGELAERGADVVLSGPWPAYHFVDDEP